MDLWDPNYDMAYPVVCVIGYQPEFLDKGGKICKVIVQDIKVMYPVDELIKS